MTSRSWGDTCPHQTLISPLTPLRADVLMDAERTYEVKVEPICLGQGSFGRVMVGLYGGARVAVKLIDGNEGDREDRPYMDHLILALKREVEVLGRCQHPNVVRLLAACIEAPRACLVMELMETSLDRLLSKAPERMLPLQTVSLA
jgi:serine/threonine protein kinase